MIQMFKGKRIGYLTMLIIFFNGVNALPQNIEPVTFDGVNAMWNEKVVDKYKQQNEGESLSRHFLYSNSIIKDSIQILVFSDNTERFDGVYIESRNLNTGELIWWNYFGESNKGRNEALADLHFDENGNIELLIFKDLESPSYPLGLSRLCQPLVRVLAFDSGVEISEKFEEFYEDSDSLYWYGGYTDLLKKEDGYVYSFVKVLGDQREFGSVHFDNEVKMVRKDTFYLPKDYKTYGLSKTRSLGVDKGFFSFRFSNERSLLDPQLDSLFDIFSLYIDFLDSRFNYSHSVDITEYIPYNWQVSTSYIINDEIVVTCRDSVDVFGVDEYWAVVFFDKEGNYLRTVDFGNTSMTSFYFAPILDESSYLFAILDIDVPTRKETMYFYQSDNQGNISFINSFGIEPDRRILIRELKVVDEKRINLLYWMTYYNDEDSRYYLDDYVLSSFALEDIGLVLSSTEETPQDQSYTTTISPNPSQGISTISMTEPFTGELTITDISGQQVLNVMLEDVLEYKLDIKTMLSQNYIITLIDDEGRVETLQWQVLL